MGNPLEDGIDKLLDPIERALDQPQYLVDAANNAYAATMARQAIPVKTGRTRRALTSTTDADRKIKVRRQRRKTGVTFLTITWWISAPGAVYRRITVPRIDDRQVLDAMISALFERTRGYRRA